MRLALVHVSDLRRRDWICHFIGDSPAAIDRLNCVPPGVIVLPKVHHPGTIDPAPVFKRSCVTGINGEFRVVTIDLTGLENKFNLL